jgi:thioredoxin reductase (NADPH)
MAKRIGAFMEEKGTKFIYGTIPDNIEPTPDGKRLVTWKVNGATVTDTFDTVMLAIGRSADTTKLNLPAA